MSSVVNAFNQLVSKGYKIFKKDTNNDIKVRGPVSFVKISGGGKTIYLFGDYHGRKEVCSDNAVDFSVFLDHTLEKYKREGKVIDIFIEETPWRIKRRSLLNRTSIDKDDENFSKLISSIYFNEFYMKCLHDDIEDCFHRFHAINIRYIDTNFNRLFYKSHKLGWDDEADVDEIYNLYTEILNINSFNDTDYVQNKIMKQVIHTEEKERLIKIFNQLFDEMKNKLKKIEEDIYNIENESYKNIIKNDMFVKNFRNKIQSIVEKRKMLENELKTLNKNDEKYEELYDYLINSKKYISTHEQHLNNRLEELKEKNRDLLKKDKEYIYILHVYIQNFMIGIGSIIMDFYTSARILRKFKDDTTPDNCIVIAGNDHVKNMIHIFEKLNYKIEILDYNQHPLTEEKTELYQCINMNKNLYENLFG